MSQNLSGRITVVLCRPIYPRNIGMCARAMANMGLSRLVLIAPQNELNFEAKQGATKAQEILSGAKIFDSLSEFYADEGEGVRIALSARVGQLRAPERFDLKLASLKRKKDSLFNDSATPIYLLFGPEDDGLNDEEIRGANHVCYLPTFGQFYSMNLSHAVMLATYIAHSTRADSIPDADAELEALLKASRKTGESAAPKSAGEIQKEQLKLKHAPKYDPERTISAWLETLGFSLDQRQVNAARVISRLLLENEPSQDELRVLEAVIQQTIRKLKS